jgi:hypothetical protein
LRDRNAAAKIKPNSLVSTDSEQDVENTEKKIPSERKSLDEKFAKATTGKMVRTHTLLTLNLDASTIESFMPFSSCNRDDSSEDDF